MDGQLLSPYGTDFGASIGSQGLASPKPTPQLKSPPPVQAPQVPQMQPPPPVLQVPPVQGPPPIDPVSGMQYIDPVNLLFGNFPQKDQIQEAIKGTTCLTKQIGLNSTTNPQKV